MPSSNCLWACCLLLHHRSALLVCVGLQLVEAHSGLQAVIRVLQVAQSRGIKTTDAPGADGDIAILWGDAGVADGKLDE
jgi:hypothetical protein